MQRQLYAKSTSQSKLVSQIIVAKLKAGNDRSLFDLKFRMKAEV